MRLRTCLVVNVLAALALAPPANGQGPVSLLRAYDAYAAGEQRAITGAVQTPQDFVRLRDELPAAFGPWRQSWDARHSGFLVELAWLGIRLGAPAASTLLSAASDLVTSRPEPIGSNSVHDRQEALVHRAAVAVLAGGPGPTAAEYYLSTLPARVWLAPAPRASSTGKLVDPRLILSQAILLERRSHPATAVLRGGPTDGDTGIFGPAREGAQADFVRRAMAALDLAAEFPDTAAEARVRRALLSYRMGDRTGVVDRLAAAVQPSDERAVRYWSALFAARLLEDEGKTADAEAAYGRAALIMPDAQTPAVALAALLVRSGRTDDAFRWAARARTRPAEAVDPWFQYVNGDLRFLGSLFAELQGARP